VSFRRMFSILRRVSVVGVVLLTAAGSARAAEPALEITVPGEAVTVGDRVEVRIQARGGDDGLWGDLSIDAKGSDDWAVVEGPREVPGAVPPAWKIVVVPLKTGEIELPGITASLRDADGEAVNVGPEETPEIRVGSVLTPEDDGKPAPLRDPVGVTGFPWEWTAPVLLVLAPLIALGMWLWWRRNRRGAVGGTTASRLPPLEELENTLREIGGLIGRGPADLVCDRLAAAVRLYLERRTGEPAVEMTSNELRSLARSAGWPQEVRAGLQRVTDLTDSVRFGRRPVGDAQLEAAVDAARDVGRVLQRFLELSQEEREEAA